MKTLSFSGRDIGDISVYLEDQRIIDFVRNEFNPDDIFEPQEMLDFIEDDIIRDYVKDLEDE